MMLLDTGQSYIQSLEFCRQASVINAQAMQNCRVQVVNVDRVFRNVVAEVVGLAVNDSRLDSAASHPD